MNYLFVLLINKEVVDKSDLIVSLAKVHLTEKGASTSTCTSWSWFTQIGHYILLEQQQSCKIYLRTLPGEHALTLWNVVYK